MSHGARQLSASSEGKYGQRALLALLVAFLAGPFTPAARTSRAHAQESDLAGKLIQKIDIDGLVRTPRNEVLGRLRIRVGDRYDVEAVEQEAARLFALGKFDRVGGPFVAEFEDGVSVRFTVVEKPTIFRVGFSGRKNISESELMDGTRSLYTREGKLYNRYVAVQDEQTVREKYLADGYLFVEVSHTVTQTARGVIVTFRVQEGTRVRVREIRFVGNRSVSDDDLLEVMKTQEKDFWFFGLVDSGFFQYRDLRSDALSVERLYHREGFLDARAEVENIHIDPTQERLIVTIRIEEGSQYTFRGYRFNGNAVYADSVLRDLTSAPAGRPYNEDRMETDRLALLNYYKNRAFIFASVERKFMFAETGTDVYVRFDIEENNEIHINEIRIRGNRKTEDRVPRRELEVFPGERVDNSKLVKSRSNLARLGIFNDIQYSYEPTGTPSSRNLIVNVDEAGRGQIIFGVGVTNAFGVVGNLQVTMQNFDLFDWPGSFYEIPDAWVGAGQTLHLVARPGTRFSRYRVTFVEPYLFDTRNALSLTFQSLDILREDWEEGRTSFQPQITHDFDFDHDLSVFFGGRVGEIEVSDLDNDAPDDAFEAEGHTTVIGLNVGMQYDKALAEPFQTPHAGHYERVAYNYVGDKLGGDIDYHSFHLSQDLHFPLYTHRDGNYHHVITFRSRYGWMKSFDSGDEIPIFERFFLGGPNDVKGFRFRGLGPHQRGDPIGGTAELWGTLEYSFPIYQRLLRGVVFLDYGNLDFVENFRFKTMRYSAGGGLRINFPFLGGQPLPIGLYFGTPIRQEDEDEDRLFLFTIGNTF